MRKFDCISFRIRGNTDVKKELTGFVSKFVWRNPASKVKIATEIFGHSRRWNCWFSTVLWTAVMNEHEQSNIHRIHFLKIYLKIQMFLYSNEIHLF